MENIDDSFMKDDKATYDAAAKEFLSDKSILAWLLKYCVAEFKNCGIKEIAKKYNKSDCIIVNLSGRGDKDLNTILN